MKRAWARMASDGWNGWDGWDGLVTSTIGSQMVRPELTKVQLVGRTCSMGISAVPSSRALGVRKQRNRIEECSGI